MFFKKVQKVSIGLSYFESKISYKNFEKLPNLVTLQMFLFWQVALLAKVHMPKGRHDSAAPNRYITPNSARLQGQGIGLEGPSDHRKENV